ncbi:ATP-dependent DNA helicase [Actinomyces naeslundii]|uniref:DNA 3'-5' helicase n=2 Tax=Actinomyces naeslundii TaxID=1655 RepID=J3F226_ACTNH|nr:ATP-dependent DNA helicase [Actinomyces naeslundii]EJN84272.1 UvrD/REP helicase N-terminal domain protein [Actinomyces naeslundii str. Howell 279]OMG38977.1 ATP-dependent DNA helicase [Actinomyces naeslundii]QQC21285.1 ATP-dependent helicase [Actinomyces naeslundii]
MTPTRARELTPQTLAEALGIHTPTEEQSRVIAHRLSPLLVVAGAGSGKTATMAQRVVYLVATGQVRPDQVLGLTFTRKATAELDQRVASRLVSLGAAGLLPVTAPETDGTGADTADATDVGEPMIATYNSFAGTLVRDHGLRIGIDPDSALITQARSWQIVTSLLEARTLPLPNESLIHNTSAVLVLVDALSQNLLTIDEAAKDLADLSEQFTALAAIKGCKTLVGKAPAVMTEWEALLDVVAELHDYKRSHGLLDFGDQIALACTIAESVPEAAAQVRAQYPAVLLDEFQDTSVAQVRFLSALFADSGVTAVGDPHQAIYGWRGASAGALDTFHQRFNPSGTARLASGIPPADAAPVLELSTSWRNDSAILDVANAVSEPLRSGVVQDGDPVGEHIAVAPLRARPVAFGLKPGTVHGAFLQDPAEEARTVAAFLAERWSPDAEMAVLCRTRAQMEPIAAELERTGLPYTIVGLGGMLYVPEVADVRALLTAATDPERGDRVVRLLTGFGIGASDLHALAGLARDLLRPPARSTQSTRDGADGSGDQVDSPLLSEALDALLRWHDDGAEGATAAASQGLTPAGLAVALRTARAIRRVREALALPLPDLVALAEQALGLDIEIAARVDDPMGHRALDSFQATALGYATDTDTPTPTGFLEWLDAAEEHEDAMSAPEVDPTPGAVQLLTVHAAKGLEWDAVAVPGMDEQVFPSYTSSVKEDLRVVETGWMGSTSIFPFPLRADADDLPPFTVGDLSPAVTDKPLLTETMTAYKEALGRQSLREERRLAYVAFTRARHDLLLTGSHLSKTASKPRRPSRFLTELRRRDLLVPYADGWVDFDESRPNPLTALTQVGTWPLDAGQTETPGAQALGNGQSHDDGGADTDRAAALRRARQAAAAQVAAAMSEASPTELLTEPTPVRAASTSPGHEPEASDDTLRRWRLETDLLLAERARATSATPTVRLPEHLAATRLDDLRADRRRFALDLRRPLPPEPRAAGRLGTVFHDAVAQLLSARGTLFGLGEAGVPDNLDPQDRQRVERWLGTVENLALLDDYVLVDTEIDREITIGATTLRCRMDAVFRRLDGSGWLIVDWKTGRRQVPVDQLSVYVHAWAASQGVSAGSVRAAYVYVDYPGGRVAELAAAGLLSLDRIESALTPGLPSDEMTPLPPPEHPG